MAESQASEADPAAVFALLADETRVRILQVLATADGPLAFADLCSRVDVDDTGRFNYHLGRLRDALVEKTADGYVLTEVGERAAWTTGALAARPE